MHRSARAILAGAFAAFCLTQFAPALADDDSGNARELLRTIKKARLIDLSHTWEITSPVAGVNPPYAFALEFTHANTRFRKDFNDGGQLSFATDASPNGAVYPTPGPTSYTYKIRASSAGCPSVDLTNQATVNVSAVTADAGGDKNLCIGDDVTIGGSPTGSGGTGFLSVSWTGPSSFSSTSSNPTVTVAGTYTVTVKDNTGATDTDNVLVTGLSKPTIAFVTGIRTQFNYDESNYLLSDKTIVNPNDGSGVFSGQGVSLNSDGNYYFNPQAFTSQAVGVPITYTHTSANGCSDYKTFDVDVNIPGSAVTNFKPKYCYNDNPTTGLFFNQSIYTLPPGMEFSSLKVYGYNPALGYYGIYPTSDPKEIAECDQLLARLDDYLHDLQTKEKKHERKKR